MKTKEAKYLVSKIFGDEAANDSDIVDFYLQVNKDAMQECADEQSVAFAEWIKTNAYSVDGSWYLHRYFSGEIYTTTELLNIFKNENK